MYDPHMLRLLWNSMCDPVLLVLALYLLAALI